MTSRGWSWTYFIPIDIQESEFESYARRLLEVYTGDIRVKYVVFQFEKCPSTDRVHLQGYIQLRSPSRMPMAKAILTLDGVHLEKSQGTPKDNIAYCSKEESRILGPFETGERPKGSGKRSDLEAALETFERSDHSLEALARAHPIVFIKHARGFRDLKLQLVKYPNDEKPEVYWYYGPTGTGKSYRCRQRAPDAYRIAPPIGTKNLYFYGYNGETDHIFEDYNGYGGFRWLLVFLSEGRLTVNGSGHGVPVRRTRVFINSDRHPRDVFPTVFAEHPNLWAQLRRRITEIIHCTEPYGGIMSDSGSGPDGSRSPVPSSYPAPLAGFDAGHGE